MISGDLFLFRLLFLCQGIQIYKLVLRCREIGGNDIKPHIYMHDSLEVHFNKNWGHMPLCG